MSGMGIGRTNYFRIPNGKLGPKGAENLARLLRDVPPSLLISLDLRHLLFALEIVFCFIGTTGAEKREVFGEVFGGLRESAWKS